MKLISIGQFWEFVDRSGGFFACWPWQGPVAANGYGTFKHHSVAHRVAYELTNGPIPDGMTIDHTCHNNTGCTLSRECPHRRCCNPSHLEAVSNRENILRGESPAAKHAKKTHCPKGHEYTPETTRMHKGSRECRECDRERNRQAQAKRTPEQREALRAYNRAYAKQLRARGYYSTPEFKAKHREYQLARYHRNKGHTLSPSS